MGKIWESYENLNEIIYVTDISTNELVYMNKKTRRMCGIDDNSDIKGMKCHDILQGSAIPCAMCNNEHLKVGEFIEWRYFNPVYKKNFLIKDTLVEEDGKKYRMELAIDIGKAGDDETLQEHIDNEAMLNEGLKISLSSMSPEDSIRSLLEFLGKSLKCERSYIFEGKVGHEYDNTYEWCASGVVPQIDNLQQLPFDTVRIWIDRFQYNENVIIRNLDDIRESDPAMYDCLYPQDIHTLAVSPLKYNGEIIGFYGVDNPPEKMLDNIATLLQIMGHFMVLLIKRCDLFKKLEKLSYYDRLTGLGNRHAMDEYIANMNREDSIGIVYCDVMGLKKVNDNKGHQAGDLLLMGASESLKKAFPKASLFRIGGDEFLVLRSDIPEDELLEKIENLKVDMKEKNNYMAIGSVWRENAADDIDALLAEADELMYKDKRTYYEQGIFDRRKR